MFTGKAKKDIFKRFVKWGVATVAVVLCLNILDTSRAVGVLETVYRRELAALDWQMEDLDLLGGGYSCGLVSSRAHRTYRSRRGDRALELYIELERRLPFGPWILSEFRHEGPAGD